MAKELIKLLNATICFVTMRSMIGDIVQADLKPLFLQPQHPLKILIVFASGPSNFRGLVPQMGQTDFVVLKPQSVKNA